MAKDATRDQLALCHPTTFDLAIGGEPRPLNSLPSAEVTLIAREALLNAFQHAQASHVQVHVDYGAASLKVEIKADGTGLP